MSSSLEHPGERAGRGCQCRIHFGNILAARHGRIRLAAAGATRRLRHRAHQIARVRTRLYSTLGAGGSEVDRALLRLYCRENTDDRFRLIFHRFT